MAESSNVLLQPKFDLLTLKVSGVVYFIYPILLSVPIFYGVSIYPSLRKKLQQETLGKDWAQKYEDLQLLAPFILPKDKAGLRSFMLRVGLVATCTFLSRVTNLLIPVLLRQIVDSLTKSDGYVPWKEIIAFVLLRQVISEAVQSVQWTTLFAVEGEAADRVTSALYNKLMTLSADYHETKKSNNVYSVVASSGARLSRFAGSIIFDKIPCIIDLIIAVIAFWRIFDGHLAVAMAIISIIYVISSAFLVSKRFEDIEVSHKLRTKRDEVGFDTLANWPTVSAFNRIEHEQTRFGSLVRESREGRVNSMLSRQLTDSRKDLIMASGLIILLLLATKQIKFEDRSVGDFVMLLQFWSDLAFPLQNLVHWLTWIRDFFTEAVPMLEILREEPTIKEKEGAVDYVYKSGEIEFENVGFSYDGKRQAVEDVSFRMEGGKTIAIVGETGGGKSTLLKLLCRTHDVTSGSVRIDGQDVRNIKLASLMEHVSIVPQIIGVFNASILDNLKYGDFEATQEDCEGAVQAAALQKKVTALSKGYEEIIGTKGVKLSGGELQRLAIARTLIRNSKIVLFDEAMSSLDSETEWNIQSRLREWCVGRTVVIVAHRLATIAHADLILAVKDGHIVEAGRQEDLLEKKGYYYSLWDKQKLV